MNNLEQKIKAEFEKAFKDYEKQERFRGMVPLKSSAMWSHKWHMEKLMKAIEALEFYASTKHVYASKTEGIKTIDEGVLAKQALEEILGETDE